jgi:hypothetical protein
VGDASASSQVEAQPQARVANEEELRAAAVEPKDPLLQGQLEHQVAPGSFSSSPSSAASSFVSTAQDDQEHTMGIDLEAAGLDPQDKKDIVLTLRDEVHNRLQEQIQVAFDDQEEPRMASEASMAASLQEILAASSNSARESSALNRTVVDLVSQLTSQGDELRQLKGRVDEMMAEALVRKTITTRGGTAGAVANVALVTKPREVVEAPASTPLHGKIASRPVGHSDRHGPQSKTVHHGHLVYERIQPTHSQSGTLA